VTDVAFEVGFGDLSHFVRTFRRAAGVSPGRFGRLPRSERKFLQARLGATRAG
jgi:AraC family transcriptional regulator